MTLGPILPGRIPDTFSVMRTERNLRTAAAEMNRLQQQMATGQRFFYGSEAPGDAARTVQLQSLGERKTQAATNTLTGLSYMAAADDALSSISDILNSVKQVSLASVGDSSTPAERDQFVVELNTLLESAVSTSNREFRGRSIFAGSAAGASLPDGVPFDLSGGGVRFSGDTIQTSSFADLDQLLDFTVDPTQVFGSDAVVRTLDATPPLSAATRLDDLNAGKGVSGDTLVITSNGVTAEVDLRTAGTLDDLRTRVEDALPGTTVAFAGGSIVVTPPAGTVEVQNASGQRLATDLGLSGPAAATVNGRDLRPALTTKTPLADLFGGAGVPSLPNGLQVTVGDETQTLDFTGAVTVEDFFNVFELAGMGLSGKISDDGRGLEIVSRTQGAGFSIGEAGGTLAADLGLRTFDATTPLSALDEGLGVPTYPDALPGDTIRDLNIVRRDGTEIAVDLTAAVTVQDVLDAVNAIDPGVLTASLRPDGNGIRLEDTSGTDDLIVLDDFVAETLGLSGSAADGVPLDGTDTTPVYSDGFFSLMVQLRDAIGADEDRHVARVSQKIDTEIARFSAVRGDVGTRMRTLDQTQDRLSREQIDIAEQLSNHFDADLVETITRLSSVQASYEATLSASARLLQVNLLSLL